MGCYIRRMDPTSFPAAIVSSLIIVAVLGYGMRLAREEVRTGIEPKAVTPFTFGCIGLVCVLWYFESDNAFIENIVSDLIGALIGLGSAHFVLRFARSRRRGRTPRQEPRQ